jgi:hypothetical protein
MFKGDYKIRKPEVLTSVKARGDMALAGSGIRKYI